MKQFAIFLLVFVLAASVMAGCSQNQISDEPFPSITSPTEEPTYDTVKWESILKYDAYIQMDAQERTDFKNTFENPDDFFIWHAAAKAAYDKRLQENQIGMNGTINMDEIAGKQ